MLDRNIPIRDIRFIAKHMREADREEVAAASGLSALEVLLQGIDMSEVSYVYRTPDGEPIFIVGVGDYGTIWLLATDGILKHRVSLTKLAARCIDSWNVRWPRLHNIVDARNTVHIRWLRAMGFQFGEPIIAGVAQIPFIPFFRELNV